MTHIHRLAITFCFLLSFCVLLSAQYVQSERAAIELGPKNAAYIETLNEYRELTKKLTAMKVEYQSARPERQIEIDAEYPQLFQQGLALHRKSIELALEAFDEAPNRNPLVDDLLYSTVIWEFHRENYEKAVRIFRHLAPAGGDAESHRFFVYAGLSALLSMNFEEADKWLEVARESGELGRIFREWQSLRATADVARAMQSQLIAMPETKAAWERELEIRKTEAEAAEQDPAKRLPRVEITTSKGRIVLELFENEAPNTVANFITLVERGFYNNTVFHRVLPNFMAQGGDPTGTGRGGPGYTIDCEAGRAFPQARQHFRGSISMANAGRNTNGSQFFLTFVPIPHLDGGHTVFGRIVEGIEVLSDIQRFDPSDQNAMIPVLDRIVEARVLNKRDHSYEVRRNAGR